MARVPEHCGLHYRCPFLASKISSRASRTMVSSPPGGRWLYTGNSVLKLSRPGRIIEYARRPGQTVMLAQHCPGVFGPEQPAPLQNRDHLGAEHVELRRQQRRHDIEPVRGAVCEPILDQLGNLFRGPGGDKMPARTGQIAEQLPQCRLVDAMWA